MSSHEPGARRLPAALITAKLLAARLDLSMISASSLLERYLDIRSLARGARDDHGSPSFIVSVPLPHLLHIFPSFGIGGMQLRTARIITYLGTKCRHTLVSLDGATAAAEHIGGEVAAEIVSMPVDKHRILANFLAFRGFLADAKPDVLATYNWGTIEWAAANRLGPTRRHIHFEAGFGQEEATRQFRRRVLGRRFALAKAECLVVPSRTLERIALDSWGLSSQRVRYIPDGIDLLRFAVRPQQRLERSRRGTGIVVGTVTPLRPEKNITRLIEAFVEIAAGDERFRLVIAGDGPEDTKLKLLAAARGMDSRVQFLGHVQRPEDLLPEFDIFCLSSDTEQMPNAVLEAMAAGLPIAAVDVGDVRTMVGPANRSYIVPGDRLGALAAAIRALAADPSLRQHLGEQNRIEAEARFGQDRMFREYEAILLANG